MSILYRDRMVQIHRRHCSDPRRPQLLRPRRHPERQKRLPIRHRSSGLRSPNPAPLCLRVHRCTAIPEGRSAIQLRETRLRPHLGVPRRQMGLSNQLRHTNPRGIQPNDGLQRGQPHAESLQNLAELHRRERQSLVSTKRHHHRVQPLVQNRVQRRIQNGLRDHLRMGRLHRRHDVHQG